MKYSSGLTQDTSLWEAALEIEPRWEDEHLLTRCVSKIIFESITLSVGKLNVEIIVAQIATDELHTYSIGLILGVVTAAVRNISMSY